jgi:Domain of unknown function (DU1801)
MAKAELKTKETEASVDEFINQVEDPLKREDCKKVVAMMEKATGKKPKMWGPAIIGFDQYHYKYESGHEGDMCRIGFSPRKQNLTLYFVDSFEKYESLMSKLGKYKTGKCCLYVKKLSDIDENILNELIELSVKQSNDKYGKN